ncbi:MAG: WecB/TagA/CpsF family glycosyltransferase [Ignavibacteria bacterium]|nr:WecB/TagA/CpsF family glycosyltransferase [Ignavibacteria bacterium]
MRAINILGFDFLDSGYDEIISVIDKKISGREVFTFLNVNPHIINEAAKNIELEKNLKKLSAIYADGIGVYIASKILYGNNGFAQKITGTDLYYKILSYAEANQRKIFFFGGGDEAVGKLERAVKERFTKLKIGGIVKRETNFSDLTVTKIRSSNSDILFVGLGSPHQEEWLSRYSHLVNVPVQIAMGSGIEFISGNYNRAPVLFQNLGLEWFYRFLNEPARLWKRYFLGNPLFIYKIFFQKLKK